MLVDSKASATTMFMIILYNINHDLHILADGCMTWQPFLHKNISLLVFGAMAWYIDYSNIFVSFCWMKHNMFSENR